MPDLYDEGVLLTLDKEEVRSQVTVHVPGLSVHAQPCNRYRYIAIGRKVDRYCQVIGHVPGLSIHTQPCTRYRYIAIDRQVDR